MDLPLLAFLGQRFDFGRVLVVAGHGKTLIGHVEQEIASHDAKADHPDFISLFRIVNFHGFAHQFFQILPIRVAATVNSS